MIFSFSAHALTLEEERKYDELEGLAFIKALISDKKYEEVIRQFPDVSKKKSELRQLHFHLAEAHFHLKGYQKAHESLVEGEKYERPFSLYYSLWGRTSAKLRKFSDCRSFFKNISLKDIHSQDWETYYNCLIKSGNAAEAVSLALNAGLQDQDFFLMAQRTFITHGLYTIAAEQRVSYQVECRTVDFYLRLWTEVQKMKAPDISVLEMGHACHPKAMEVTSHLVKALFQEGKYHTIAYLFEVLSSEERSYLKHTAEFYKVAGRNTVADYFFTLGDEHDYILARSSYFLNQENYAALLTIPFRADTVKKNKDLSYALAYSHFKFLALDASSATLEHYGKKSIRSQQLEGLIEQCREMDWRCRP